MTTRLRGAAAATTVLILLLSGCASPLAGARQNPAEPASDVPGQWTRVMDFPLEPRDHPITVWTGTEVLVFGGYVGPPCPPTADCVYEEWAADGAALDPSTGIWREVAPVPREWRWTDGAAFLDGRAYVSVSDEHSSAVLVYDVESDRWTQLENVPDVRSMMPVAHDGQLVFVSGSDEYAEMLGAPRIDRTYDPATGNWAALPDDPFTASFSRYAVSTPHGLVLSGAPIDAVSSGGPVFETLALLPTGSHEWTRLPDTGSINSGGWAWTGTRLVAAVLGGADGGQVDGWGRTHPYGGVVELPGGAWSELPDPPAVDPSAGWMHRVTGARYSISAGHLYDDATGTWTPLPRPADAPSQPGAAVWAGEELVLLGGTDWRSPMEGARRAATWVYAPTG
jgi:hypothetical protein